jgi:Intracellular proteinase inhibitor
MRRTLFFLALLMTAAVFGMARAIDINPSKDNQPSSFWDTGGNRFSIFNGDPKRIQRANAVDPKAFDSKVEVTPNPLALQAVKTQGPNPGFKITFSVHNHAKKTYTLSFPTAQRWDFRILNAAGTPIYVYSDNCEFEQKVGTSMVNNDDRLVYIETVDFDDLGEHLAPGVYTVQTVMANYPEIHAEVKLTVQP